MVNKNLSTHPADMQQHRYSFGDFFLSTHLLGRSSAMLLWSSTLGALLIDPAWLLVVMRLDSYSIFACNELVLVLSVQEIQFGVQRYDVTKCILSVRIRSCDHTCCKMYRLFIGVSFVENLSTKERMIFNSPSRSKHRKQQKEQEHCLKQYHRRCYPPGLLMAPYLLWVMGQNHRWLQTKSAKLYLYIYLLCHSIEFLIWFLQPAASPVHHLCLSCIF